MRNALACLFIAWGLAYAAIVVRFLILFGVSGYTLIDSCTAVGCFYLAILFFKRGGSHA